GLIAREFEASDPAKVEPVAAAALDELHLHRTARWTSHDDARCIHVHDNLTDRMHRAAGRAGAHGGRHFHSEDLPQESADRIAIELQVGLLHGHVNLLW